MLRDWSDFFGMTGSAAATLVGLLFVAVTLGNGLPTSRTNGPVDRIFHNLVPLAASVSLALGGAGLIAGAALGPFAIASASMLLLLSGIYRTWGQSLALIGMQEKL